MKAPSIPVELVYAQPERQTVLEFRVPPGTTLGEALHLSGLARLHPELDLDAAPVGLWGKLANRDAPLSEHDRIEVYRGLIADPKQVRRKRAQRKA